MMLGTAVNDFLAEQQFRGNTPKTIVYYAGSLKRFTDYAGEDIELESLTIPLLRSYFQMLKDTGLSSNTIQTYIRALRTFLTYCYTEEYLQTNIAAKFKLPRAEKKVIDVLTDAEVNRLFACFGKPHTMLQLRNYCICSLMIDSGLRMNEVVTLALDKLKLEEGYIIVEGKGQKERIVPVGNNTRKMLRRYLNRVPVNADPSRVFVMSDGRPIELSTIKELFRKLKRKAEIPRLRAHLLRHTFATRYLENGGDIFTLQQILGHTSLEMVKKYLHTTHRKIVPKFTEYSPLDTLARTNRRRC